MILEIIWGFSFVYNFKERRIKMKVTKEQLIVRINELAKDNLNLQDKVSILTIALSAKPDSQVVPFITACETSIDALSHTIIALTNKIR